ncbi:MAG TPA: hypothetical protein VMK66_13835 [Myxococcales bacterium]|nr:hypothetical protein [Myxococcales bacterium]
MKPSIALLAVLLVSPCACARHDRAPPQTTFVEPIDPGPLAGPGPGTISGPKAAEPEPPPTPAEVAAFHAPVPK